MNQQQALVLITYLNRAGLVGVMENQAPVWAEALEDTRFEDAQAVAKHMVKTRLSTERWVTPGDVRDGIKAIRDKRLLDAGGWRRHIDPPAFDETEEIRLTLEWERSVRRHIGDGLDPITANQQACTEMGATPRQIRGDAA